MKVSPSLLVPRTVLRATQRRGATLLEAMAFLAIAAFVILGGISMFENVMNDTNLNTTVQNTTSLVTAIKRNFTTSYSTLSWTALGSGTGNLNVVPNTWPATGTGNRKNSFGGDVTLTATASNFTFGFTYIPQKVCAQLAAALVLNLSPAKLVITDPNGTAATLIDTSSSISNTTVVAYANACTTKGKYTFAVTFS